MQVTPSNALFAALSAQIQSLQQNAQNQPQSSRNAGGDKSSRAVRIERSDTQSPATVLNSAGQVETNGGAVNPNLREAPGSGRHGGPVFTVPGSVIDITV